MRARSIEWRPETVARFWDYVSQREDLLASYFTYQVGLGVTKFLSQAVSLAGSEVLDYGCGRGHLIRHLLDGGAAVRALDSSPESVHAVEAAYAPCENWRGARLVEGSEIPWPADTFDVVTCLETLEHVLSSQLEDMLCQILHVLKPGGIALFSTPNSENLLESTVCCPNCLTEFHRWQHVRCWNAVQLGTVLSESGYQVVFCRALDFARFQEKPSVSWKDYSPRVLLSGCRNLLCRTLDTLHPRPFPRGHMFSRLVSESKQVHLAAVARKTDPTLRSA